MHIDVSQSIIYLKDISLSYWSVSCRICIIMLRGFHKILKTNDIQKVHNIVFSHKVDSSRIKEKLTNIDME